MENQEDHLRNQLGFPVENSAGPRIADFESTDDSEFYKWFPPGFRFKPTDQEIIQEYLIKKIRNEPLPRNRIHTAKVYEYNPDQLAGMYKLVKDREDEWYFFTSRNKKYPNGLRPNRSTGTSGAVDCESGYWKLSGKKKQIVDENKNVIGTKSSLEFHNGKQSNGTLTPWKMHEYEASGSKQGSDKDRMLLDEYILVRLYIKGREKKKSPSKSKLVEVPSHVQVQVRSVPPLQPHGNTFGPSTQLENQAGPSVQFRPQPLGFGSDGQLSENFHNNHNLCKSHKFAHHEEVRSIQYPPPRPLRLGFGNNCWSSENFHNNHRSDKFPSSFQVQPPPLLGFGNNFSPWTQLPSLQPPLNPNSGAPLLGFSDNCQLSENFHNNHRSGRNPDSTCHEEVTFVQAQPPPLSGFGYDYDPGTQLPSFPPPLSLPLGFGPLAHLPRDEGPSGFGGSSGNVYNVPNDCGDEHPIFVTSPSHHDQGDLYSVVIDAVTSGSRGNSTAAPMEKEKEADEKNAEKDVSDDKV